MAKIIVIEGTDGSGKSTQKELLTERLKKNGRDVISIKFPRYETPSGMNILRYLHGDFGSSPEDVNAYAASAFYAVDRYASYKSEWKDFYEKNSEGFIILDRYTSSNIIHQGAKISGEQKDNYCRWVYDFEYGLMELPQPEIVIVLDMPPEYSSVLTGKRGAEDIHEKNTEYVKKCYDTMIHASEMYSWTKIRCVENGAIRSPGEINDDIFKIVKGMLE